MVAALAITLLVEVPIDNQIETWRAATLPGGLNGLADPRDHLVVGASFGERGRQVAGHPGEVGVRDPQARMGRTEILARIARWATHDLRKQQNLMALGHW